MTHSLETKRKISESLLGVKHTEKRKQNMREAGKPNATGDKHRLWKGEKAKYWAKHEWVTRWKGKPTTCEGCGKKNLTGQKIHWANIDHKYRRILDDYIRLCASCHKLYDISNGLIKLYNK